jgi:3-deoxy-D-manno-octulosonic-acid transferase
LVLVPRHPERFNYVADMLNASGIAWQRRSELGSQPPAPPGDHEFARVLLVDTIGELSAWWGTATIAFVGGSFGSRGGQNMIEPAAYGAAVSFGPNTWNFRDIVANLLAADAAAVVQDAHALETFVRRCLDDPQYAAALGERAQAFVRSQLGATARTTALLDSLCRNRAACQREAA